MSSEDPQCAIASDLSQGDRTRRLVHDLRTPLNGILGFAALIRDGKAGPVTEMQREFLDDILESARQLARLVDEALGHPRQSPVAGADPRQPGAATGETVLVVDDEDEMRALVRESLKDAGYAVLEASDGDEALMVAGGHDGPIHLVITDVMMPHVDGGELARRLRTQLGNVRLLYVSAYATNTVADSGGPLANSAFLAKPFTPAALVAKVREVLDRPAAS